MSLLVTSERGRSVGVGYRRSWKVLALAVGSAGLGLGASSVLAFPAAAVVGGQGWSIANVPGRGENAALLSSDTCWGPSSCVAVGGSPSGRAKAEVWDGKTWSALGLNTPPASGPH